MRAAIGKFNKLLAEEFGKSFVSIRKLHYRSTPLIRYYTMEIKKPKPCEWLSFLFKDEVISITFGVVRVEARRMFEILDVEESMEALRKLVQSGKSNEDLIPIFNVFKEK